MKRLAGKNAVITGCNRGIGKAILEKYAESGANVWACLKTFDSETEALFKQIAGENVIWIRYVPLDLEDDRSIQDAVRMIRRDKKNVDILVNNAGIPFSGMLATTSAADLRRVMNVNFIAPLMLIQGLSRIMIRQRSGCIINMASVGGIEAREGYLAYGASKAALIWATKQISRELGHYNIRVNGIAPGLVETRMGTGIHSEEEIRNTVELSVMKRLGKPEEIADVAVFLASDEASFITGQVIRADGGR